MASERERESERESERERMLLVGLPSRNMTFGFGRIIRGGHIPKIPKAIAVSEFVGCARPLHLRYNSEHSEIQ
jgi:hypothetical protein